MEHAIYSVTLLALLAAISHVQAQEIGDPQKGLALARSVCSECHAIGREQVRSPNAPWWRAAALGRCTDQPRLPLAGLDVQRAERNTIGHARRLVWAWQGACEARPRARGWPGSTASCVRLAFASPHRIATWPR
jgi:hypothetical protein